LRRVLAGMDDWSTTVIVFFIDGCSSAGLKQIK